jgi:teichuronic acid biosynthesis glycosyltransferase TuaC
MKILFLHKRFYMQKDLINDRYGRFFEIPDYLAKSAHQVELVCHSYRSSEETSVTNNENFTISSRNLGLNPLYGFWKHFHYLDKTLKYSRPDIIIAGSDCYQIIIGSELARRHNIPFIADLYDNFAWYKASRIPGVLPLFARALKRAQAVTVVSGTLMQLVESSYRPSGKLYLVENAVSKNFLAHHKRDFSRNYFGLEPGRIYIGTAGELSHDKGVDLLLQALAGIVKDDSRVTLVLAGSKARDLNIPDLDTIRYLGELNHDEIPLLFSGLDIGVICIKDNAFGRYCFPQKFYEMVACNLPVVVSDVGEMSLLLEHFPAMRFKADDGESLQRAIREQIRNRQTLTMDVPDWESQARKFDSIINDTVSG